MVLHSEVLDKQCGRMVNVCHELTYKKGIDYELHSDLMNENKHIIVKGYQNVKQYARNGSAYHTQVHSAHTHTLLCAHLRAHLDSTFVIDNEGLDASYMHALLTCDCWALLGVLVVLCTCTRSWRTLIPLVCTCMRACVRASVGVTSALSSQFEICVYR